MTVFPDLIHTPHELRSRTPDGLDLVVLSGFAEFVFKGIAGTDWHRDVLVLRVGPQWSAPRGVVHLVSRASFQNEQVATYAGWAVDEVAYDYYEVVPGPPGVQIQLEAKIAVRDVDGYLLRASYYATAIGTLESSRTNE